MVAESERDVLSSALEAMRAENGSLKAQLDAMQHQLAQATAAAPLVSSSVARDDDRLDHVPSRIDDSAVADGTWGYSMRSPAAKRRPEGPNGANAVVAAAVADLQHELTNVRAENAALLRTFDELKVCVFVVFCNCCWQSNRIESECGVACHCSKVMRPLPVKSIFFYV